MWKPIATLVTLMVLTALLYHFLLTSIQEVPKQTVRWVPPSLTPMSNIKTQNSGTNISIVSGHADVGRFASFVFGHEEGFVAVTAFSNVTATTRLLFYKLADDGTLNKLPEEPLIPSLEGDTVVVTGGFMPPRQVPLEVLYLFVVIGVLDREGHPCGRSVRLYYYDKDIRTAGSLTWTYQRDFVLDHPLYPTSLYSNPGIPAFVACLGNHIQGVVDDNARNGQALYVSTSDFDRVNPDRIEPGSGGGVLWYEFQTYGPNPLLQLRLVLKDAKLVNEDRKTPLTVNIRDYYLLGFGSSFFVQSGQGRANLLAIANQTDQDSSDVLCPNAVNAAAPNGYVQLFRVSERQSLGWEQIPVSCGTGNTLFSDRLWQNPRVAIDQGPEFMLSERRFGHSLFVIDNFVFVGIAPTTVSVYKVTTPAAPPLNLRVGSVSLSSVGTPPARPGRFLQRRFFAHKQFIVSSGRTVQPNSEGILVWRASSSISQTRFTDFDDPIISFGNTGENSGSPDSGDQWFGSSCFILTAPNQRSNYLVFNDPDFDSKGRVLIKSLN